jgi:Actin-like ATPase involved in cell division
VIQIDSVVEALNRAVSEANTMAGTRLQHPLISVGGSHLVGQDVVGTVMLSYLITRVKYLLTEAMAQAQVQFSQVTEPDRDILSGSQDDL